MKENVNWIGCGLILGVIGIFLCAQFAWATPLDDYINADNPSYTYSAPVVQYTDTIVGYPGYFTGYILDMTSQTWRNSSEVDRPEWQLLPAHEPWPRPQDRAGLHRPSLRNLLPLEHPDLRPSRQLPLRMPRAGFLRLASQSRD